MLIKDLLLSQNKIANNTLSIISDPDAYHLAGRTEVAILDGQNVPLPVTITAAIGDQIELCSIAWAERPDISAGGIQLSKNSFGVAVIRTYLDSGGTLRVTALPAIAYVAVH